MRVLARVTAVLVITGAAVVPLPLAWAGTTSTSLGPSVEAWFQPNPSCATPAGCTGIGSLPVAPPVQPPSVPLSPYPAGTLHVGWDATKETARTYLSFTLPLVAPQVRSASLDIPLDAAQSDGSLAPESAHVLVCPFNGTLTPAEGSIETPPPTACATSAVARYVATPTPHLHADLAPLLDVLAQSADLVLLPDAAAAGTTDAWRVVFSSHTRTGSGTTPAATLKLTLMTDGEVQLPGTTDQPDGTDGGTAVGPSLGAIDVPGSVVGAVPPPSSGTGASPRVRLSSRPQARVVTFGYAYPTVWLLPLALLVLVPLVTRALTRDLTPVERSPRTGGLA